MWPIYWQLWAQTHRIQQLKHTYENTYAKSPHYLLYTALPIKFLQTLKDFLNFQIWVVTPFLPLFVYVNRCAHSLMLWPYQCCHRKQQWLFSTWRTAQGQGWHGWVKRNPDRGWHRRSPCCLTPDASSGSGCVELPRRCRWTARRWLRSCGMARRWLPPQGTADHRLKRRQKSVNDEREKGSVPEGIEQFILNKRHSMKYDCLTDRAPFLCNTFTYTLQLQNISTSEYTSRLSL